MNVRTSWVPYATLLVIFWGVWGAFSSAPTDLYGYPEEMIYVLWSLTMLVPNYFALRGHRLDRRPIAVIYGLVIGFTGAGGQLLLFKALDIGPAYLIFPLISISPAVTVLMAIGLLRERIHLLASIGVALALASIPLFSISDDSVDASGGSWLLLALIVMLAWGVQAYYMRKAALIGVNDATTFTWMTITGLALAPVAMVMMGGLPLDFPAAAPALTLGTQMLNAVGSLFLVMALSRGKAAIVSPVANALAPVVTIILSLVAYQTLPSMYGGIGIVLALVGSTLIVYGDETTAEGAQTAEEQEEALDRPGKVPAPRQR